MIEKLLKYADFSKESTQKNQLYYELFHTTVPVMDESGGKTLLDFETLGAVAGGIRETDQYRKFRAEAERLLGEINEEEIMKYYRLYQESSVQLSVEQFLKHIQ